MLAKPHIIALALGLGLLSNGMEGAIAQPVAGEGMRGAIAQNTSSGYPTPEAAFLATVHPCQRKDCNFLFDEINGYSSYSKF